MRSPTGIAVGLTLVVAAGWAAYGFAKTGLGAEDPLTSYGLVVVVFFLGGFLVRIGARIWADPSATRFYTPNSAPGNPQHRPGNPVSGGQYRSATRGTAVGFFIGAAVCYGIPFLALHL